VDTLSTSDNDIKNLISNAAPQTSHRKLWLILLGIIIALLSLWYFWQNTASNANISQYQTTPFIQGNLTIKVTATGTLEPLDKVEMSSETSGTVKAVLVEDNDLVKTGQVLLELDTKTLGAQVKQAQAQANVQMAHAQIRQSEITLEEKSSLIIEIPNYNRSS